MARSSVTGALQLLRKRGLAQYEPYGCVTLTRRGQAAAREVVQKHDILKSFFVDVLGIEKETAQRAACRAEHALGPEIIGRLLHFMEFVASTRQDGDMVGEFRLFHGERSTGPKRRSV